MGQLRLAIALKWHAGIVLSCTEVNVLANRKAMRNVLC